jgi:alkylation response protein AidB-like acyl-CoA dehydrogenase
MKRTLFEDEHQDFRASVKEFVKRHVTPHHEAWREQRFIDRSFWLQAGADGLLGLDVPVEHGGAGIQDFRFNAIITEEMARAGAAVASAVAIHNDVVAPYLLELATEEQKQRWLPGFCTGERLTAIGMTEPEAGSDLAGLRTTAKRDGDRWIVNGSKTFITNGFNADLVVAAARTGEGRRQISLFGIEADAPGFTRGRKLDKVGQPEADTAELFFTDLELSDDNRIGELHNGFAYMMERLAQERLSTALASIAHAGRAFEITLDYVKTRKAFGRPVGTFQANRFAAAEISTQLDVAQAYVDHCVAEHVAGRLTPVDAAKAKWWSAEIENRTLDTCAQLHGGYGYMREYHVAQAWMDGRVTKIWAGSNEIMKEVIGRSLGLGDVRA